MSAYDDALTFLKRVKQWKSRNSNPSGNREKERDALLVESVPILNNLKSWEETLSQKLNSISAEYDAFVQKSGKQLNLLKLAVRKFKSEHNLQIAQLEKLKRSLKKRALREDALKVAVLRLEEERRQAFGTVLQPHWEVPHHFHMIALEHFRGNKQKQIMEIAELFPGHLRICAMAKQTALLPHRVFPQFKSTQKAKENIAKEIEAAEAKITTKLSNYQNIQELYKNLLLVLGIQSSSKETSPRSQEERKSQDKPRFKSESRGSGYLNIKRRYFQALNRRSQSSLSDSEESKSIYLLQQEEENFIHKTHLPASDHLKFNGEFDNVITYPSLTLEEWKSNISDIISVQETIKKERKKVKEDLDRVRSTRASFEAEMALLRLLK